MGKEPGDRKALVILGDGHSDDTADEHDQVVKAAKNAGVVIHALGYLAEVADSPKFQALRRLADDTGGFRREARVSGSQKFAVSNQFAAEALENGGTVKMTLMARRRRSQSRRRQPSARPPTQRPNCS